MKQLQEPLTKGQSLLWIGQELHPNAPLYNMVMTYELKVPVVSAHFSKAFYELQMRYDALRSIFEMSDGLPAQVFLDEPLYTLEILDFSHEQDPKGSYKEWEAARILKPFDISTCLVDSALIKLSESHYIWYINQHHLITDAWSNGLLFTTITRLYEASLSGESLDTSRAEPTFEDYIHQRQSKNVLEKTQSAKTYWTNKIKNSPPKPDLYGTPPKQIHPASTRSYVNLGKERSKKLRALANEKGIRVWTEHLSLYNIFLTTLFAYVYRVSGQEQIVIGSPTHNRTTKKHKETVGYFVEIFPLIATIDTEETFRSLLHKIQLESNDFLKHATASASTSEVHKSFNVLFNYIHAIYPDFNGSPVQSQWVHSGHHDPGHHVRLHVHDLHNSGEIQLYFDLNKDVFDAQTQEFIPAHFLAMLDAFIADKGQLIANPGLTDKEEIKHLHNELHREASTRPIKSTIVTSIEEQAQSSPLLQSIVFGQSTWTYQELNTKANQLAHFLKSKEIGVGSRVAIWLKRSPEYVLSVLAILKTGATYISVPHDYPQDRIAYILKDSEAAMLIVQEEKQLSVFKEHPLAILSLNSWTPDETVEEYTVNLSVPIDKEATAFIIYTSGSTGQPKGVKITHESLANYIQWTKEAYITASDISNPSIPLFTTVGFDITANSVFLPLICGGTVHIYQESDQEVDLSILDVIADNKVDFIKLTPAHLNFIKDKDLSENKTQVVVVTGDIFKTTLGLQIHKAFKDKVKMYNEYGPSEATIGCTYHLYNPALDTNTSIPIGLPIHNTQAYILDAFLHPVPRGVIGELYIGGKGLSSGYWNKDTLTAAAFIENPFDPETILYRTQDLVRLNNRGELEFIGRSDFQVKINGHRIELGEIEASLLSYPGIMESIVIVSENEEGFKSLTAFFSSCKGTDFMELQQFLSKKLPRYMIPVQYRQLEQLPLSSNGKVDRQALQGLQTFAVQSNTEYLAPRNEIEQEIASIWQAVLNIEKIGVHDSFIALGGESLMAIQITTRINETFEIKVPLTIIFELQTIASISSYIEELLIKLLEA